MRMLRVAVLVALGAPGLLATQSTLAPGAVTQGEINPGEQHTLVLALEADQCARLELDTALDFSLTLRKPDGTTSLLLAIAAQEWAPAPLTIIAAQGGRHSLELRLPDDAKGGSYRLRFDELRQATERDRKQAEGEAHLR